MTMASLGLIEKNVIKGSSGEDNTIRPKADRAGVVFSRHDHMVAGSES